MNLQHEFHQVGDFHAAFGVTSRTTPTTSIAPEERLLRVKLVVEEALEFAEAMGVVVNIGEISGEAYYEVPRHTSIDLIEVADALADSLYVVYGSAHTLGIPIREVFAEVHRSNMAKLGPDGKPIYREGDNKVLKPEGWTKPDIAGVLAR